MRSASSDDIDGVDHDVADRRDQHGADLARLDARVLDRLDRGGLGEVDRIHALARALARDDAGALADPLVARVDRLDQLGVGHDDVAARGAEPEDARVLGACGLLQGGHAAAPSLSMRAWAAARSSGVLTATVGRPLRPRFARPTRAPAGRELDEAGDARLLERLHGEVPAHGRRDLADEQVEEQPAVGDRSRRTCWSRSGASGRARSRPAASARRVSTADSM